MISVLATQEACTHHGALPSPHTMGSNPPLLMCQSVQGRQRVRMCKGERPTGAAKGKQTKSVASCQTPHMCPWDDL